MLKNSRKNGSTVNFRIDEISHAGTLKIEGSLTEKKAIEVRCTLEASVGKVDYFKLNLENVTTVDLESIQSLYSTCESLGRSKKPMRIEGICPVVFTSAVEETGFSYHKWLCFGR